MAINNKYTAVVVEDEPLILANTIQKIENAGLGFEVIGKASNGRDALEIINELKPDIVFTDIRMPIMDGLEMTKSLRDTFPELPIVILSGYNEFDYARQALKLGVTEYLLKPLETEQLVNLLKESREKIKVKKASLERQILTSYLNENLYQCPELTLNLNKGRFMLFLVCLGNLSRNYIPSDYATLLHDNWKNIDWNKVLHNFPIEQWWIIDEKLPNMKFILLSISDGYILTAEVLAKRMLEALTNSVNSLNVNICTDTKAFSHSAIWEYAQTLRLTMEQSLVAGKSRIHTPGSGTKNSPITIETDSVLKKVTAVLQSPNKGLFLKELHNLLNYWDFASFPQRWLESSLSHLFKVIASYSKNISELELYLLEYEIINKLFRSSGIKSIYPELSNILESILFPDTDENEYENLEELVHKIRTYINENYTAEISIEKIANKFGYNHSYLTRVFKKVTGESPVKYIIRMRIDEAKRLIESHNNIDIGKIGKLVGYEDQHYFSRIFKNVTGVSPSEYKEKLYGTGNRS